MDLEVSWHLPLIIAGCVLENEMLFKKGLSRPEKNYGYSHSGILIPLLKLSSQFEKFSIATNLTEF